jgi:dimethylhistidine N-methyltransferase
MLDLHKDSDSFAQAVLEGLGRDPKSLSPKYLYDRKGSELFDRICDCEEYYVTRTETAILERHAAEMAELLGERPVIVELGSGASRKTRILLDAVKDAAAYVPVDISREFLRQSAETIRREYPGLRVFPVCADFTRPLSMPENELTGTTGARAAFFPGSTIGNFHRGEAKAFLRQTAALLGRGGRLLIGVDLIKPREILEPAYDDAQGITAAFNLNLLHRMRDELGARVDPQGFRHQAVFNETEGRIEMHLVSLRDQELEILGQRFRFGEGETLHTECSYKYSPDQFEDMARQAGFAVRSFWTDPRQLFGVYLLEVERILESAPIAA